LLQAALDDGARQLQKDATTWASKLQGYSRLLGAALSVKGIDICWREAQALAVRQQKQLATRLAELRQKVEVECQEVVAANRRFEEQQLKGVEGKGRNMEVAYLCASHLGIPLCAEVNSGGHYNTLLLYTSC
jgi:hypothetical protein